MLQSFFIRIDGKYLSVPFEEIRFIEACKNYVHIVTPRQTLLAHTSLNGLQKHLPESLFCRIHRSYIVALNKISAFDHEYVYMGDTQLHLSPHYSNLLKSKLLIIYGCDNKHTKQVIFDGSFSLEERKKIS